MPPRSWPKGEKTRFDLGESTLLFVNLREIAKGDAALQYAEATASLFRSYADYQAVLGIQEQLNDYPIELRGSQAMIMRLLITKSSSYRF